MSRRGGSPCGHAAEGQRLVVAVLEEVYLLGHPDPGADDLLETLVEHDREALRFGLVFNLDFDVDSTT